MRVAVTGASGFVGGVVCGAAAARGWEVLAYGRRPHADLGKAIPYTSWDLVHGEPPNERVDAVIHCAGSVTDWGSPREIWQANLTGTRNAMAAFSGARFVHVSTASVYDPFRPTVMATEDEAPVRRYANAYGAAKASAENAVMGTAVILRPHAIYGDGDTTLLPRLLRSIRAGRLLAVGSGATRLSLTSVDNLAQACLLAVEGPVGVYNVTDRHPVTLDAALRELIRERGLAVRPLYVPEGAAMRMAALAEAVSAVTGRPPRLTRYAVGHLAVERTLDITKARELLGYEPAPTSFAGAGSW
ncbi:NAD-dependent epimerase/dehydratase family protein [Nonomuraea sp. NPDC059194]|uniref:NAD-dependent epimerase/dehydratase family protein n=1 Tax=Nonomuraea sp. NPDC059194 TaxID=3346764 RepID=UPI003676BFF7